MLHSALSERERYDAWQAAARGDLDVVVGARSAVFAPLPDVRMIVVDEEHESSYKQDSVPRYDAVDVARERMRRAGGVLVLGSATPALEDYARAQRRPLSARCACASARPRSRCRQTHVVDMTARIRGRRQPRSSARRWSRRSRRAWSAARKRAVRQPPRQRARFVLCRACGHVPQCARCSTSLVVHRGEGLLRCHYCDAAAPVPAVVPGLRQRTDSRIRHRNASASPTEVADLFPAARIVRMDSDTTTRVGDHARLLDRFARDGDVLVGTQMVAKGLDFPEVTLVGAIAADLDLHVADYRAAERTFGARCPSLRTQRPRAAG